jgi:hypothetical protein
VGIVRIARAKLVETFGQLRSCGDGKRECQVLWLSSWADPDEINCIVHPIHAAHMGGFELDSSALTELWRQLAKTKSGIRVQVHTHPGDAFHSVTDDRWPIVSTPGFLSLVIPTFALGPVGFDGAFLAELGADGRWYEVEPTSRIAVT